MVKTERMMKEKKYAQNLRSLQTEQASLKKYQKIKSGLMQDLLSGKVEVKIDEK